MLRALLLKDLLLMFHNGLWGALLVPAFLPIATQGRYPPGLAMMVAMFIVVTLVASTGVAEERARADILPHLLPVGRRRIVAGRYLFMVAVAAGMAALALLPFVPFMSLVLAPLSPSMLVAWWLLGLSTSCIYWSLVFPVTFAHNMTGTQVLLYVGLLVWFIFLGVLTTNLRAWFSTIVGVSGALGLLAVATALVCISCCVSIWIYERRDL